VNIFCENVSFYRGKYEHLSFFRETKIR